ncbi:hypothetical protein [Dyella terrae]|uniref:hypothetical protein n=1 Tax=Dyella terrae TaxID=522259 RepID=UPI001EFD5C5F|nr:hypothetical protein [Dyella terrae]ULU23189.1 hypothetical protein DYST_00080 [Dyella terrae]
MTNVAEALFRNRKPNATASSIADQLGKMVWQSADNGASIHKELADWIEHGDEEHAAIALAYDEALLFGSPEQMSVALDRLAVRLPELGPEIEVKRGWLRGNFSGR